LGLPAPTDKVEHQKAAEARGLLAAFRAEARTIASLEHLSIVPVLDFGVEGNTPFLVMRYAPGGTLHMRYPRGTHVPLAVVVSYVQQISSALHYAHERRLVHRDVKPENLPVGRNNEVLLGDFGIALVAQSSRYQYPQNVAGTISYMAPEQIQSYPCPASDQYSLGIVLYEWLGGEVPFKGAFTDVAVKHALMRPPSLREKIPTLSPFVEQVVLRALAKEPHQRFPTVLAFASALKQASEVTQHPPQAFPMSDTAQDQSWQSTFVKTAPRYSLQPTVLNALPTTPIPNPSLPQTTLIADPSTPIPKSVAPVYTSSLAAEAFPKSMNVWKREAPRSMVRSPRFRVVLIAVVCAVVIAGFVSSLVLLARSPQHVLLQAQLVVDHSLVDFGAIEKGAKVSLAVDLSNAGEQPLSFTADAGKVTWLQVQTRSATVEPGKNVVDNLTLDTASLPLGPSSALLVISSNHGNAHARLILAQ
jgi:serine/threonine protein kinase